MKPSSLIVNPTFAPTLNRLVAALPQGILLHGERGIGLHAISLRLAGGSAVTLQPMTKKGDVDSTNGTIGIERIRGLYEQTRSGGVPVVIIDDAERMSKEAQNAFLKLLEEPSRKLHFILTSHHPEQLLSTVRSRVQSYHVPRITDQQSQLIIRKAKLTNEQAAQALFLAAGRPTLLHSLTRQPKMLAEQAVHMNDARTFLSAKTRYERIRVALQYGTSRPNALQLVDAALQIIHHNLYRSPTNASAHVAERLLATHDNLAHNASPRLQLVQFVLE